MIEFFAMFTLWELILTPTFFIILLASVANEKWYGAWAIFIVSAITIHFVSPAYSLFTFIYNNPLDFLLRVVLYILIGLLWSFIKWYSYVKSRVATYLDQKKEWDEDATREEYRKPKLTSFTPDASNNLDRLFGWAAFWPWSLLWAILSDAVKIFYEWLIVKLSGVYNWITKLAFKNVN